MILTHLSNQWHKIHGGAQQYLLQGTRISFLPIPLGLFRRKRKKNIMGELFKLICSCNCFCNWNHHFHQCMLYITMSSIGFRATTLCSAILSIVYTLTSTNLSTHLTGHCAFGQCKISLLPRQFVLKQQWHLHTVGHFYCFITLCHLPCIFGWLEKNQKLEIMG